MIADSYTHFCTSALLKDLSGAGGVRGKLAEKYIALARIHPQFVDYNMRLRHLARYGIDLQVITAAHDLDPNCISLTARESVKLSRMINRDLAQTAEKSRGSILGIGSAPLNMLEVGGLEVMDQAVKDLGLRGFMVPTNVQGLPLDADHFSSFWDRAAHLDVPVYIHPTDPPRPEGRPYEAEHDLTHVFGWPFETTLILMRIVFAGILERHPRLRILVHHLGGMIPFFAGRVIESYHAILERKPSVASIRLDSSLASSLKRKISKSPMHYLRRVYYDTAVGGNPPAIRCGYDVFGSNRLVFATDYPWGPKGGTSRLQTYPSVIKQLGLSQKENEEIFWGNSRKLLKLS